MRKNSTHTLLLMTCCLLFLPLWAQAQNSPATASTLQLDGHLQRHVVGADANTLHIVFSNMLPSQTYTLVVPDDPALKLCMPTLSSTDPGVKVLGYDAALHELRFTAQAKTAEFVLEYPCTVNPADPPRHYISLLCQTCKKKKIKEHLKDVAILEVQSGASAEELVKDVMIGGNCFDVTGVTFSGQGGQIGTFTNGLTNVGFATGMVMATGDISVCPGPNDQDNASAGYGNGTPDNDLSILANGGNIFDMAKIEFDFTPTQTPLTFEYVFGSEEYCEYVNTQFNDVFGFFISGPGFTGNQNIAVLPGGLGPVSINNVNHATNSGFYVHNTGPSGNNCGTIPPSNGPAVNELQFDGYTRRMVALAPVIPCQTYHIQLKVGDVGDGIFDSAVFLKAGSFDAGGNASVDWVVNGDTDEDEVYEGCGTVKLVFDRVGSNLNVPLPVQFTVTGTATPGVDYSPIPSVVSIPAGQDKLELTVNIFTDQILEGQETIIITLNNPCSCLQPQTILKINDLRPVKVLADTVEICGPGVGVVTATGIDGAPEYTYLWSNGSTSESIAPYVTVSTNYRVTITDKCGKTSTATGRVIVNPLPNAQLLPPAPQLCPGQPGVINVNFNGPAPYTLEYTLNGDPQPPITDITQDPYQMTINQVGLYQITSVTDGRGCTGPGQGALLVTESTLSLSGVVTNVKCAGQTNGSINTTVVGGQGPYNYVWDGPQPIGNIPDPINLKAGTYKVTVTDGFGCTNERTYMVQEPGPIVPAIVNTVGPNCSNPSGGSIDLDVTGGTPNFTYKWNNGATLQDPQNLTQGTYTVTVTDQSGCTKTTTASVVGDFAPPTAAAVVNGSLSCIVTAVTLDGTGSSTGTNFSYLWTTTGGNITGGGTTLNPTVNAPGTYTLKVTNSTNGCTSTAQVQVSSTVDYPIANAGPLQTLTCALPNVTLNGAGSSTGSNFSYQWTFTPGGNILGGGTTLNPVVDKPATYTLIVTNTANGCSTTSTVTVGENKTLPNAVIAQPGLITCVNKTVTLNGSGSGPSGSITFAWTTANGKIESGQTSANAVVSETGTYQLVVTNSTNGCTHSATVTVNQDNSVPTANAAVSGTLNCTTKELTLNGNGSSTGAGYTFQWTSSSGTGFVSGQTTLTPVVNAPATYTLLVTNTINNCTASASILVTQDILKPLANPGAPGALTCTNPTLVLGDPNAPVAPNLNYVWTTVGGNFAGGSNTPTPTVNAPGVYSLVVTNSANGCTSTASVNIDENKVKPTAVVAPAPELNCTTPALQLNGNGSSTGPNFAYDWTSSTGGGIGAGANTLTPTITAAGTYTLLVTNNANGCTSTAAATVNSNANLPTAVATPSGIITCAVQQITLSSAGSSSGPTFIYQWGTVNGKIESGGNTASATVSQAGQYTLLVTNTTNNCTASFSVEVNADLAPPIANAGPKGTLNCTQPSSSLDGSGSSAGANFTYAWTRVDGAGGFTSATNIITPSVNEPGIYQLVVTNTTNGCSSSSQVQVQADANDPVPVIAAPGVLNCKNNSQITLNATGSTTGANISYKWTGPLVASGGTTLSPTVSLPGTYTLVITNAANGCTSSLTTSVSQDIALPPVDAGPDEILNCYQPQLQLSGTGNPVGQEYTFLWTGPGILSGANTPTPVINQSGTYQLVVTNTTNGCSSTDLAVLNADFDKPTADAGPGFQLTCVNNTYTLQATASTGAAYSYAWTTNTGNFTSATDILNPTVNGAGNYYLTVTDTGNGCTAVSDVQVTKSADVPVSLATNSALLTCATTTLTLSGAGSSAGAKYRYQWAASQGGHIVSGANTLSPVIDKPGTYELIVMDTTNNCKAFSSVVVSEDVALPDIDGGPTPTLTCKVKSVSLAAEVKSNGSFIYLWDTQDGKIVSGANTLAPVVSQIGTYQLTVTNTLNGCSSTAIATVDNNIVNPNTAILQPEVLTCKTQVVTLDATGSSTGTFDYGWTTAGGNLLNTSNPLLPQVDKPGIYTLLVTDQINGCTSTASTTVSQDIAKPVADAGSSDLITCKVTSLELDGSGSSQSGNFFYQWTTVDGQILVGANTLKPTVVKGGTYTLNVVNNDNGCSSSDNVLVNSNTQQPLASLAAPDILTCIKPQVTINGSASQSGIGIAYAWTTQSGNILSGSSTNSATVNAPGEYTLTVLNNNNGCSNTASVQVGTNIVLPIAEAGTPFTLTCSVQQVTLQGSGSPGPNFTYSWTTVGGQFVAGASTLSP
ncbi:MAG TPA: choice-of-anchor L domain-containing protein, partial [Saprospiraceae bacterium]|nr:choice-of-anchor L domain-containing protein [Saprospiraceae bacterium]